MDSSGFCTVRNYHRFDSSSLYLALDSYYALPTVIAAVVAVVFMFTSTWFEWPAVLVGAPVLVTLNSILFIGFLIYAIIRDWNYNSDRDRLMAFGFISGLILIIVINVIILKKMIIAFYVRRRHDFGHFSGINTSRLN